MRGTAIAAIIVTALPVAASAADRVPAAIKALGDCRSVADGAARLKCYDSAAAGIAEATAKKDIVILDREEVRQTRRGLFGFTLPRLPFFGGDRGNDKANDVAQEEVDEIDAVVATARGFGYKFWRLTMEDGAIWATTEAVESGAPRPGSKVHIKRATFGSYFLKIDNGRAVKAKREG